MAQLLLYRFTLNRRKLPRSPAGAKARVTLAELETNSHEQTDWVEERVIRA